jgi:hypothetical protein
MYVLKGFCTNGLFINNTPGATAAFGEISTFSMTFAKEKGFYNSEALPDLNLITFLSSLNSVAYKLSNTVRDHVLAVMKSVYDYTVTANGQIYSDGLLNSLLTQYAGVADTFACGAIVNNGTYYAPEWISWRNTNIPEITDNAIKIWLSDSGFQTEYDEYEIVIVPPVDTMDSFFNTGLQVDTMLNSLTPTQITDRVQAAKNGFPESIQRTEVYDYIDPLNNQHKVPSIWNILIYGAAGNNVDSITDALTNYILAHSAHPKADWVRILPDLFRRTEFVIMPLWENYAIPNRTLETGIYSPIANLTDSLAELITAVPSYPSALISANACLLAEPYKSLAMLVIGGPDNINNEYRITSVFPDYIAVSSTSVDFNRMSAATQGWATLLETMVITAETLQTYSAVPMGMTKMVRDNILYLTARYNNVYYLVMAKSNFPLH